MIISTIGYFFVSDSFDLELSGAILLAPIVNPYEPSMTKEEKRKTWGKWTSKRKFLYILARKFPSLLPYFYSKTFLSGMHGDPETFLSVSLTKKVLLKSFLSLFFSMGNFLHPKHLMLPFLLDCWASKDKALMNQPYFKEFWERNMEESIRQRHSKPFVEEAVLQVSDWGFTIADLHVPKNSQGNGLLHWLKSFYSSSEREWAGFTRPIHVWQVCPLSLSLSLSICKSVSSFSYSVNGGVSVITYRLLLRY